MARGSLGRVGARGCVYVTPSAPTEPRPHRPVKTVHSNGRPPCCCPSRSPQPPPSLCGYACRPGCRPGTADASPYGWLQREAFDPAPPASCTTTTNTYQQHLRHTLSCPESALARMPHRALPGGARTDPTTLKLKTATCRAQRVVWMHSQPPCLHRMPGPGTSVCGGATVALPGHRFGPVSTR